MQDSSKINDPVFESQLRTRMQALASLFNQSASQLTEAEKAEFDRLSSKGTSEQGAVEKVNEILRPDRGSEHPDQTEPGSRPAVSGADGSEKRSTG